MLPAIDWITLRIKSVENQLLWSDVVVLQSRNVTGRLNSDLMQL